MKKIKKQLICMGLVLVMLLPLCVPVVTNAEETKDTFVMKIDGVEYTVDSMGIVKVPASVDFSKVEIWILSYNGHELVNVGNKSGVLDSQGRTVLEVAGEKPTSAQTKWVVNFIYHAGDDSVEANRAYPFCTGTLTFIKESANGMFDKLTLSASRYTYNGKVHKPGVRVKDVSGKTIAPENYEVTYSGSCKKVGTYSVTVTGVGEYEGSTLTQKFTINPKGTSVVSLIAGSKNFTAKIKTNRIQTTGYQLRYRIKNSSKWKAVTIKNNTTVSRKISSLKANKYYQVQVRTYKSVGSRNYYSAWSATKMVKTK